MRKLVTVKKELIKSSAISIFIVVLFAALAFGAIEYQSSKNDDLKKIKREIKQIKSNIASIKNERKEAMRSYKIFKLIPKNKLPTSDGYETSVQRQIIAKKILIELNDRYKFTVMDPKLSPPELKENLETISIINSSLDINFDGMSDELVLAFISDIKNTLPGYLKLTKLNIARKGAIDDETLEKIDFTKSYLPLVSGTMSFEWYTLKNKEENKKERKNK